MKIVAQTINSNPTVVAPSNLGKNSFSKWSKPYFL